MDRVRRIAVVTGAGSGIGRQSSLALADAGYTVVLAGRKSATLQTTRDMAVQKRGDDAAAICIPTDVTDPAAVDSLFAQVKESFGRVDVVFNNAGIFSGGEPIDQVRWEDWREAINVNLHGAFLVARAAFREMKSQHPQGGRIINNGSISAQAPRPHAIAYTASKHAVTGLTKALILEGRAFDIACSQIDIGNAATDMTGIMGKGMLQADGQWRPETRFDAVHVAETIVHMAKLPLTANIPFVTIMATAMPFIGRG